MTLKLRIKALDEVDEELQGLYKEATDGQGGFVLKVETAPLSPEDKAKLAEFRNNNRTLFNEKEALEAQLAKFKGMDPEQIAAAQKVIEQAGEDEERKLIAEGKLDEVIKRRTAARITETDNALREVQDTLKATKTENERLREQLGVLTIDTAVQATLDKVEVKPLPGAMPDIIRRARSVWKIGEDGKMKAVSEDGSQRYGDEGEALTMDEFVSKDLLGAAKHLFEGSSGGGSSGGRPGDGPPNKKVVDASDPDAMGRNLEDIASGKKIAKF